MDLTLFSTDYDSKECITFIDDVKRFTDRGSEAAIRSYREIWEQAVQAMNQIMMLGKKWQHYRDSAGITPIQMIRSDITKAISTISDDLKPGETGLDWGIRTTQEILDVPLNNINYFPTARYCEKIVALKELIDNAIRKSSHSEVLHLFGERKEHRDSTASLQYATNEMVSHLKFLNGLSAELTRDEIVTCLGIYLKQCGIYESDAVLIHCLLQLAKVGHRDSYSEAHPTHRGALDRINHIKTRDPRLYCYNNLLRNAVGHTDFETDFGSQQMLIQANEKSKPKPISYQSVLAATREMSAMVVALLMCPMILANTDWIATKILLDHT